LKDPSAAVYFLAKVITGNTKNGIKNSMFNKLENLNGSIIYIFPATNKAYK